MASARSILHPQRLTVASTTAIASAALVGFYAFHAYYSKPLSAESPEPPKVFTRGMNFVSLRLHSTEAVNHNTKRLRFELPNPDARSGLNLTSSLLTVSRPPGRWLPVIRPYTPVSDLEEPGYIEFLVKQYPNGKASTHLHSMIPGQTLYFAGPIQGYQWSANKHPHVVLIAGGAGITPMYQLLRGILTNPDDRTKISLVWGVNTDEDIFLGDELQRLQQKHPGRFSVVYAVSNPSQGSPHRKGYITKELLEKASLAPHDKDTKAFVCGPPAMEASMTGSKGWSGGGNSGILKELGYRADQIHRF